MRETADEADGVGKQDFAATGQLNGAKLWIKRGEHTRRGQHVRTGKAVEESALAGVSITHKRDRRYRNCFAALTLLPTYAPDIFDIELQVIDAALDAAPVHFELRFTRAAGANTSAELRHGLASSRQARKHVFKLGKLDLQLALARAGMAGKDVENKLRAVQNAARKRGVEVAKLCRRQIVIEEHQIRLCGRCDTGNLFDFTGTDQRGGVRFGTALYQLRYDLTTG